MAPSSQRVIATSIAAAGPRRRWAGLAALALLATGCAGLTPGYTVVLSQDILEIKNNLGKLSEAQSATDHKLDYSLGQVNENLQTRNDQLKTSIEDIAKRINDQRGEMEQLRAKLEELSFALDSLKKKLDMTTGVGATPTPAGDATLPGPGATPPAAGGSPVDQAIANGLSLYNTGRFKEAREAFRQALDQKPADSDKALEIQFWLAESCLGDKDLTAAFENYTNVIRTNPSHLKAWVSLERMADIQVQQNDPARALEWYKQIRDNNPNYQDIERVKGKIARLEPGGAGVTAVPTPGPTPTPAPDH